jgi:hypothetical protein
MGRRSSLYDGSSAFPPQPDGVFEFTQDKKPWNTGTGPDRYRRGMYTYLWRSSPYPMLLAFDAPGGNVSCTRRMRSNTPLQSLTLANDQAFYECAAALAERVVTYTMASGRLPPESTSNYADRARRAFRLCVSREPTAAECELLSRLTAQELTGSPSDASAAWTRICRVLLNLDETITKE